MPHNLNYHHLLYFWTSVRAGRITAAARELHLSQSALSLQLKTLERALGKTLLLRTRRGVELTDAGRLVYGHCERIFAAGAALGQALRGAREEPAPVRLGVTAPLGRGAVLAALAVLGESPGTVASVFVGPREEVRERLQRRRLDLALAGADFSPDMGVPFRSSLVTALPLVFVAAPALARRLRGFPRTQTVVPVLLRTPENPLREQLLAWLRERGARPVVAAETDDADLLRDLALQGRGVAALTAPHARRDAAAGRLKVLARTGLSHEVWLNWPDSGLDDAGPVRRFLLRTAELADRLKA
ncbi:MAG: LysR family transcriptional regulator [Elusimicrobiota bacterium]|nr:LysR family transcriptional regulator [Elusimicrobiota bacterium]